MLFKIAYFHQANNVLQCCSLQKPKCRSYRNVNEPKLNMDTTLLNSSTKSALFGVGTSAPQEEEKEERMESPWKKKKEKEDMGCGKGGGGKRKEQPKKEGRRDHTVDRDCY